MHDSNFYLQMNDDEEFYVEINVLKSRNCIANTVKLLESLKLKHTNECMAHAQRPRIDWFVHNNTNQLFG